MQPKVVGGSAPGQASYQATRGTIPTMAFFAVAANLMLAGTVFAESLPETLATAYSTNPTLFAARAALGVVDEGVPQELSNWRPSVFVDGSAGVQRIDNHGARGPERTEPYDVTLTVQQFLYRGGRTVAGTERAEAEVEAQRALVLATEQDILFRAAVAHTDIWRDQSVLDLSRNNENVLAKQVQASQDRFAVGEVTRTDVSQSESRLARGTSDRIESEGNLTSSRAVYQELVGNLPGTLDEPIIELNLPATLEEAILLARENNPDVVAARFLKIAAERAERVAFGEFLPEVSLQGDITRSEETGSADSERDRARILARVSVPIYQQGFVSSRVREAKQFANQRRLEIDEARRFAEQTAISAWEDFETTSAQIESFQKEVDATEIGLEGTREEAAVGSRTILDILDAEQEFFVALVNLVGSKRDQLVAKFAVLQAVGQFTAVDLNLGTEIYDPEENYENVRNRWFGTSISRE